jgi:hypothetical protein
MAMIAASFPIIMAALSVEAAWMCVCGRFPMDAAKHQQEKN